MAAQVVSLEERIAASRRATAVERAWNVAKSLEGDREQIEGLQWVQPQIIEGRGISREIDFSSQFPEGVTPLLPTPMYLSVVAPADRLVPGENIPTRWTMPLLTRIDSESMILSESVRGELGIGTSHISLRPTIDVVSFLPFPKVGAHAEEQFKPEFYISLHINADLGNAGNIYGAVVKYGNQVTKQYVVDGMPKTVLVFADPKYETLFSGEMLVNLSATELAATPQDAGILEVYVYRLTKSKPRVDISKLGGSAYDLSRLIQDFIPERSTPPLNYGNHSKFPTVRETAPLPSFDLSSLMNAEPTRESQPARPHFQALPTLPRLELPAPAAVPKEVGDVRIREGTRGEEVNATVTYDYMLDRAYGIQPIRFRFLGVREGTYEQAQGALRNLAMDYKR